MNSKGILWNDVSKFVGTQLQCDDNKFIEVLYITLFIVFLEKNEPFSCVYVYTIDA